MEAGHWVGGGSLPQQGNSRCLHLVGDCYLFFVLKSLFGSSVHRGGGARGRGFGFRRFRGRGRGRGRRSGEDRKGPTLQDLDADLDKYHKDAMQVA